VTGARLHALAAAALFSTGGTAIKACSFGPWQVAAYRCAFAAAALALIPAARRGWTMKLVPVAAAYALQSLLFATSNKYTTAANAIFLQSTSPLYVLLLSPWLLREKIRPRDLAFLAVLAASLALFFLGDERRLPTADDPLRGKLLAAGSGVGWALTILGLRRLAREGAAGPDDALRATLLGNLLAFGIAAPFAGLPTGGEPADWALVAFLGFVQIAFAYWCLVRASRDVSAFELSLLLLLEPALSAAWAWIVWGETLTAWSAAGAAAIVAATVAKGLLERSSTAGDAGRGGASA
jgi:DME family drug/metabolite transporter